jgi:hypothetical protein
METFRTTQTQEAYDEYKVSCTRESVCWICEKSPLQTFSHWKIVENSFPYDRIAALHHMITPVRHVKEGELTTEELEEFAQIKSSVLNHNYEFLLWPTQKYQSVPSHYHVHLLVSKYKKI